MKSPSRQPLAQPALRLLSLFCLASASLLAPRAAILADTFGSGANSFSIDFVTIGNPGNPPDTTGQPNPAGSVPYAYRIGKFEVSRDMIERANAAAGLGITLADMTPYGGNGPNRPATGVSWFEAAKFVNWLNTSTGNQPAYKFDAAGDFQLWSPADPGYDASNLFRNRHARYFLPSADEWYKAAYYDADAGVYWDYPTGSNTTPASVASGTTPGTAVVMLDQFAGPANIMQAGGLSPFGTMAQAGNVSEWEETELDLLNNDVFAQRGGRGVAWSAFASSSSATLRFGAIPSSEGEAIGFRVASVIPEPDGLAILAAAMPIMLRFAQRSLQRPGKVAGTVYAHEI